MLVTTAAITFLVIMSFWFVVMAIRDKLEGYSFHFTLGYWFGDRVADWWYEHVVKDKS